MSTIGTSVRAVLRVLLTVVAGAACGTVDNRPPTVGCVPLDGGVTLIDAGHGGGGNAGRVNGCQTGIVSPPPGATGDGGAFGSGAGGLTTVDGGAFGAGGGFGTGGLGGAFGTGGSLVTGFGGGVAGSLVGTSGSLNIGNIGVGG